MALVLNDRVRETTSVVGTGAVTLLGAVTGFQSFSTIGNANTTYYCISDQAGANWEVGIGTYTSAGTLLARTTVLASSNAGALVSFTGGTKDVFVTYPSSKGVWYDASGNVLFTGTTTAANLAYTGTLTGGTGILNIGSGQIYKDASGNVGIGTSSPATILDASGVIRGRAISLGYTDGSGSIGGTTSFSAGTISADVNWGMFFKANAGASQAEFVWVNSTSLERMRIDSSGNVGIGTSSPLVVTNQKSVNVNGTSASRYELLVGGTRTSYVYTDASTMQIGSITTIPVQFMTAGTERMRIDSSGNVGIGTTSPTGKLDVAGTIKTLGYTVATLPTGVVGARAYVTDALTPVFGATVVTGGAVTIPVFYNGTNWIVG